MSYLSRSRRPRRVGEWTESKAVTFIVTLAASRSVTLAAARAGMSRKAAYLLKRRDTSFASAWQAALSVAIDPGRRRAKCSVQEPALNSFQGDEIDEVVSPRFKARQGYKKVPTMDSPFDALMRELFFATIANQASTKPPRPLARARTLP